MTDVRMNPAGVRDLLRSRPVEAMLRMRAMWVAGAARASAPRDTGEYVASIAISSRIGRSRAHARVTADCDHATIVESRHRTLGRALGAARG